MVNGRITDWPTSVSPGGEILLYGINDIMSLSLTGDRKPEALLQTKYAEGHAVFSPDGRWLAYVSNESGSIEVYVQGFPESRGKWRVSAGGGQFPEWRGDGKELYWMKPDGTLMAASVELQAAGVKVGPAASLFRILGGDPYFQPARDGLKFLVQEPDGTQQEFPMVVVQNWAARLGK